MKNNLLFVALFLVSFFNWNCAALKQNKQLAAHQALLAKTAASNAPPEEKLDILMESLVDMMDESLSILNPVKGVKYVERYGEANEKSIMSILTQAENWRNSMNTVETVSFGVRMTKKPYNKKAIDLVPKFEKKYRQVKFVAKMTNKLKNVFLKI